MERRDRHGDQSGDQPGSQPGDKHSNPSGSGQTISVPTGFANDDGSADQRIRGASTPDELAEAVLQGRVMVAVVATADEIADDGSDKSSHMSVVSMVAADGRRGLLAFSGLDSLTAWNPEARPVPVTGVDAAKAALDDGCEALVLDVAGPEPKVLEEANLVRIAGVDPLDHASAVLTQILEVALDPGIATSIGVDVDRDSGRLRLTVPPERAQQISQVIPERVLALVPAGVELIPAE